MAAGFQKLMAELADMDQGLSFITTPTDDYIKATRARTAIKRLQFEVLNQAATQTNIEELGRDVRAALAEMGAGRGGVSRANSSPAFADCSEQVIFGDA